MKSNVILFGWNRSLPGREKQSAEHFTDITRYFEELRSKGVLASWEPVFLQPHGGDLNGFFLLRGDAQKIDELVATETWLSHSMRAGLHLQGHGVIRGYSGQAVSEVMA